MNDNVENEIVRLHAIVEGRVQGVGFRYFVENNAQVLNLVGWVRNRWNGSVEIMAEGERRQLEKFILAIRRGPRAAFVSEVRDQWLPATNDFTNFNIRTTI